MTPKFSKALLAAGLAAALVGCGGGSSTTTMANPDPTPPADPDPTPPGPTPEQMKAAIDAGKTAFDTAIAAADAVINDSSSSDEAMLQAYKDKKMAAETFSTILDENGGHRLYELDVSAAYTGANTGIKETEMKIAQAEEDRIHKEETEEEMKMNDIASAYDGIPFSDAFAGKTVDYGSLRENLMRVTIGTDDMILMLNDDVSLNAIEGWMGQEFTSEDITAHVYHKQGVPYNELIESIISTNGATATTSSLNHANLIPFVNITARPVNTTNNLISYSAAANTSPVVVRGTFMGVVGDYTCIDAANQQCAVRFNAETGTELGYLDNSEAFQLGAAPDSAGNWQFKPLRSGDRIASYASYGFWIKEDGDDWTIGSFNNYRGVEERGIATENEVTLVGRTALQGTATYKGGAVGRYAIQNTEQDKFRAKVTLTADFGDGTDGNIIGTISDFMTDNNGEKNWEVRLQSALMDRTAVDGTVVEPSFGMGDNPVGETVWLIDNDAHAHRGEWMGQFSDFIDEDNQTLAQETRKPRTATGAFSAYAPNSRMVGAFGADLDE